MGRNDIRLSKKHGLNPSLLECPTCSGDMGIVMMGALPGDAEAPRKQLNVYPCDKCLDKFKEQDAIVLVGFSDSPGGKQPTGAMVVMKREAAKRIFDEGAIDDDGEIFNCDAAVVEHIIKMQKEAEKDGI